jgi:hypothetical protein
VDSPLYDLLWRDRQPRNGTWIPNWILDATGSEARARVACQVQWWFEQAKQDEKLARARARVYDEAGRQWYAVSSRLLAASAMLPQRTALDALDWLEDHQWLCVQRGGKGLRIRPNAPGLAKAFFDETKSHTARSEFLDPDDTEPAHKWTGSLTQKEAFHDATGVTVHNALVNVVMKQTGSHGVSRALFLARLLSQLCFYFADRNGVCRASHEADGNLWWAASPARWARLLAVSPSTAERGIRTLTSLALVRRRTGYFRASGDVEVRWTTMLRPDTVTMAAAVAEAAAESPDFLGSPQTKGDDNAENSF